MLVVNVVGDGIDRIFRIRKIYIVHPAKSWHVCQIVALPIVNACQDNAIEREDNLISRARDLF